MKSSARPASAVYLRAILAALLCCAGAAPASAQPTDPLLLALSAREQTATTAQLEQMAGGEDALVGRLLTLRRQEQPPFAGVRAEKILMLRYAARLDVQRAINEDLQAGQFAGLARVVAANVEQVPDASARRAFASELLKRAVREPEFAKYTKTLASSADPEIAKMAREQAK